MTTSNKGVAQREDRVKTDIRIGPAFSKHLEKLLVDTGLSKNAFFVMAGCLYAVRVAGYKRAGTKKLLDTLEKEFGRTLAEVRRELAKN